MKPQCELATQHGAKDTLEHLGEKKTKLSLNTKKSKLSAPHEGPKKRFCPPPPPANLSPKSLIECSKTITEYGKDLRIEVHDRSASALEENVVSLPFSAEGQAVAAAFTAVGESFCPICEKSITQGTVSDHWKTCLERFEHIEAQSAAPAATAQEAQSYACEICQKDLTHMNKVRRNQHLNRCIDSTEHSAEQQDVSGISWACPFCWKMTVYTTRIQHLRRCGMRHRIPFQKVMEIRQVLDRHLAECQNAGIPLIPIPRKESAPKAGRPKSRDAKPQLEPRSTMEADLQMGVALSASLKEDADRRLKAEMKEMGMADLFIPPSCSGSAPSFPEPRRRKKGVCGDSKTLPMLLVRTAAERQSIIASKVQNVVLEGSSDEEEGARDYLLTVMSGTQHQRSDVQSNQETNQFLSSLIAKDQPLMKLSALSDSRSTDKRNFYMTRLHPAITIPKVRAETNQLGSSSQIRHQSIRHQQQQVQGKCDMSIREDQVPSTQDAFLSLICNSSHSDEPANTGSTESRRELLDVNCAGSDLALNGFCLDKTVGDGFIVEEQLPLSASAKTSLENASNQLLDGLASMVGNQACSDVQIHTSDGEVLPAHRFILYIRCKDFYQEMLAPASSCRWPVSLSSARYFMTYLYTGRVDGLCKEDKTVVEVQLLADKYNMLELVSYCDGLLCNDATKPASTPTPATHNSKDNASVRCSKERHAKTKKVESTQNADGARLCDTQSPSCKSTAVPTPALQRTPTTRNFRDNIDVHSVTERHTQKFFVNEQKEPDSSADFLAANSQENGVVSKVNLPESGCLVIVSDCESLPANNSPSPCITMDDSSSSLWSHHSDVMELEKPCSPAVLEDGDVSVTTCNFDATNGNAAEAIAEEPTGMFDGVMLAECKASQTSLDESNQSLSHNPHSGAGRAEAVTVAETTMNDVMSTTTELFEPESFFTVPSSVTCQRRRYKPNAPYSDTGSTSKNIFYQLSSPSHRASTSTPLPQGSDSGSYIRSNKFNSVSSIEASPTRQVRVSSSFERSTAGCSVESERTEVCAGDPLSSRQSPVFLSSSDTRHRDVMRDAVTVEDSLAVIKKVRAGQTAHCISFNSDSENEGLSPCQPSSKTTVLQDTPTYRRGTHSFSQSLTEMMDKLAVPPPPPNSRCSRQGTPSGKLPSPMHKASPNSRSSSQAANREESRAEVSFEEDLWEGFDDDGGFNLASPVMLAEQLETPKAHAISSRSADASPRKRRADVKSPSKGSSSSHPIHSQPSQLTVHHPKALRKKKPKPITPVTPMPTFDIMTTPEIAMALKKYGVRQFPRKRAIPVLKYIYEETHPLVTDSEHESSFQKTSEGAHQSPPNAVVGKSPDKKCGSVDDDDDLHLRLSSQSSTTSSTSSVEIPEESYVAASDREEMTASQEEANTADVSSSLLQFFATRKELRQKILAYEPLNIADLQAEIKAAGIKLSMNHLMDFLDEQCITFTMGKVRRARRRQRKPKNSPSPKRRKKKV